MTLDAPPTIEQQKAELMATGWEYTGRGMWASPDGRLFYGPHGAWKAMKRTTEAEEETLP